MLRCAFAVASLFALSCPAVATTLTLQPRNYDLYDYYAVHLEKSSPSALAATLGLEFEGQLGELRDHYLLRSHRSEVNIIADAVHDRRRIRRRGLSTTSSPLDDVLFHQKQEPKSRLVKRGPMPALPVESRQDDEDPPSSTNSGAFAKGVEIAETLDITDPIFHDQWHLYNPIQTGHDLNVSGVWMQGITGKNTTVCIVDDGLDMDSEDLKDNYFAEGSFDFNENSPEPRPLLSDDRHGTRCAGEVAAVKNNICGVGVAWDAKVAGIRILSKPITDADEALAMTYGFQQNQIYSCSWGPPDDGIEMGQPGVLIKRAMITAIQEGRGGLGTIYVFAAGNGAANGDNCNFDGYTNSIYSVTVGAIDRAGLHPYYSEACSAQLVVTYSSGSGDYIHTTDVGVDQCYSNHGGTSAAGPLAVGIYALALQIRPDLTWRDIQWLTVLTAVPLEELSDWQTTTIGKTFSHQFGYGKLDAWAFVEAAKDFKSVKPQAWYFSPWQHIRTSIPQGDVGLGATFTVTEEALREANLETIEHVTVTMNINHTRRGDLSVELRSPEGIISHLSTTREKDDTGAGYVDWTFMSVAHWGESGVGDWNILVKDTIENDNEGTFTDWKLNLFGESINPDIQELLPLPTEHDDDDHDREDAVATTAILTPTSAASPTGPTANPSDHPDRPVNSKPTDDAVLDTDPSETVEFGAPIEIPTPTSVDVPAESSESDYLDSENDNFLPSPFPTFGVSKHTQIWIYGAAVLIVIFCGCLAGYYYYARRKRLRNLARDNYDFEILDEDDKTSGANGASGRKGRRRAGELYDAFAGESDEELFSEDETGDRAHLMEKHESNWDDDYRGASKRND